MVSCDKNFVRISAQVVLILSLMGVCLIVHPKFHRLTWVIEPNPPESSYKMLPEVTKTMCLGYEQLVSDIFWLRFVQYVGDSEARQADQCKYAYAFLDMITTLDPHFIQPYWFAAFIVGSEMHRPDLAQLLIQRGIRANQDNWYLPYIAGINQYLFAHKELEAAKYYRMAARFPHAPPWLSRQAEILQAKIPSLVKEVNTWDTIYRNSTDPMVKERAKEHLAATWMRVFKVSPSEEIRKKARKALAELGVEVR